MKIIVTGSSGYVASSLVPRLTEFAEVVGVDRKSSVATTVVGDLTSESSLNEILSSCGTETEDYSILHLAAARIDFGAKAEDYYRDNVSATECLLEQLNQVKVSKFVHVSSVAAFDGKAISYEASLDCDSAYRCTKFLQEKLILEWCEENNVEVCVVYPSAIFSDDKRTDTNIGKLQRIVEASPILPIIDVPKSVTDLNSLCDFIIGTLQGEIGSGKYLAIELPVLTVTEMLEELGRGRIKFVKIPYLSAILRIIAAVLWVAGLKGKFDFGLTPNRVSKLFSDTSYKDLEDETINVSLYAEMSGPSQRRLSLGP